MQVTVGECHPKKNLVHAWSPLKRISRAFLPKGGDALMITVPRYHLQLEHQTLHP